MYFDRQDIPFLLIVCVIIGLLLYSNYQREERLEQSLKTLADYNYSVIIRQIQIDQKIDKISVDIDSVRDIYLRK